MVFFTFCLAVTHLYVEGCDAESGLNWAQRLEGEVWEMVEEPHGDQWVPLKSETIIPSPCSPAMLRAVLLDVGQSVGLARPVGPKLALQNRQYSPARLQ